MYGLHRVKWGYMVGVFKDKKIAEDACMTLNESMIKKAQRKNKKATYDDICKKLYLYEVRKISGGSE